MIDDGRPVDSEVLWAARQVVRQHTESANPDRAEAQWCRSSCPQELVVGLDLRLGGGDGGGDGPGQRSGLHPDLRDGGGFQ